MISFLLVFILMALTGGATGLGVAWWYERSIRLSTLREWQNLYAEYGKATVETGALRERLAREDGIGIGRECDALQRKMTDGLSKGRRVRLTVEGDNTKAEGDANV